MPLKPRYVCAQGRNWAGLFYPQGLVQVADGEENKLRPGCKQPWGGADAQPARISHGGHPWRSCPRPWGLAA